MVESNNETSILLIQNGPPLAHAFAELVRNIRDISSSLEAVTWRHVFHEANNVADRLAKESLNMENGFVFFNVSPLFLSHLLDVDGRAFCPQWAAGVLCLGIWPF